MSGSSASSSANPGIGGIAAALQSQGETGLSTNSGDLAGALAAAVAAHQAGQPIHIVGYSWGGDTAVDLAWALHDMNIQVTTLVTIDSVGLNNRSIPPNVSTNLNYYQNKTPILQGGPNQAVDPDLTNVTNVFRPGDNHFNIDDAQGVGDGTVNQVLGGRK